MMHKMDDLETWMDNAARVCSTKGMLPGRWPAMRAQYGTVEAVRKCLRMQVERTPLGRLKRLGLLQYSHEAAVLKVPRPVQPRRLGNRAVPP
jgi:hypothetical protein